MTAELQPTPSSRELTVELDLRPEDVLERFRAHDGVQWNEREPVGWRWQGAPAFQAWPAPRPRGVSFYVRTFVTNDVEVQPPVLLLEVEPTREGSRVHARFLKHPIRTNNIYRGGFWAAFAFGIFGLLYLSLGVFAGVPGTIFGGIMYSLAFAGMGLLVACRAQTLSMP